MSLRAKVEQLNKSASMVRESTRRLNIRAAELNGVAATIPDNAPFPTSRFSGCKVVLRNVAYDHNTGGICASITYPYTDDDDDKRFSGRRLKVSISENWFD